MVHFKMGSSSIKNLVLSLGLVTLCFSQIQGAGPSAQVPVLNSPYFNLAENREISATATCGHGDGELYCNLGQTENGCHYCHENAHLPQSAIDGSDRWWQSPSLAKGKQYEQVNVTINLGQEFHVAYIFITMGNCPRPAVWALEKSRDGGETFQPLQYFADSVANCMKYFGVDDSELITRDDSVICTTKFSDVRPLKDGEIVLSLLSHRPSSFDFYGSPVLQQWAKATHIRLRLLKMNVLPNHVAALKDKDDTVGRQYFYSIKDLSIGGRCECNGHADSCERSNSQESSKLLCHCRHNTGGVNCQQCKSGYFRPSGALANATDGCQKCQCDLNTSTGDCEEGTGQCQCREGFQGPDCNSCTEGFHGYPNCRGPTLPKNFEREGNVEQPNIHELIKAYRQSAALLLRTADELEQIISNQIVKNPRQKL